MAGRTLRSPWLPSGASPDARVRLVCLPHAAAGATYYRGWGKGLPDWVGCVPVQPPGREERRGEQPLTSATAIVSLLAPEVVENVATPYAIFGHSTGALVAFELAREIRRLGGPEPVHLFVAGRRAPQLPIARSLPSEQSTAELAAVLRRLGGTPEVFLDSPELLLWIQPLLVADFEVNEGYPYDAQPPLSFPITAFAATDDETTTPAQMAGWEEQTTAKFRLHTIEGGHFAPFDRTPGIYHWIAETLGQ